MNGGGYEAALDAKERWLERFDTWQSPLPLLNRRCAWALNLSSVSISFLCNSSIFVEFIPNMNVVSQEVVQLYKYISNEMENVVCQLTVCSIILNKCFSMNL